jgi:hypothetical protein
MIDRFGRTISVLSNSDGSKLYSTGGISLKSWSGDAVALQALNGMAPDGFVEPVLGMFFAPYDFLYLFTDSEKTQILSSTDAIVKNAIVELTAIITYVDLWNEQTIGFVRYLQSIGILTATRATSILAGVRP